MVDILAGKIFLLITGASRGIGRQIAITFGKLLEKDSRLLLLARNKNGMRETAEEIPSSVTVQYLGIDLSVANADVLTDIVRRSVVNPSEFDRAIIVHNAASIGDITKVTTNMLNFDTWRKYYDLNVFSPAILNCVFMKIFHGDNKIKKQVINITSSSSMKPIKSAGYYCSGKAAREMYFKVFAEEFPDVNVLNYSPNAAETAMLQTAAESFADMEMRTFFRLMHRDKRQITIEQSADRLVEILKRNNYKSGAYMDYSNEI